MMLLASPQRICWGCHRPGFKVVFYDTLEDFYLTEALEYITAWRQATPDTPAGICGPIGPTEQLPLVARLVNELEIDLRHAHFWGMDEWVIDGVEAPVEHPLSFRRADMELCFNRIRPDLRMPEANLHFPAADLAEYKDSWNTARCFVMQGGQGEVKHWAFNDPPRRAPACTATSRPHRKSSASWKPASSSCTPMTLIQNARTSGGGVVQNVPSQALSVGPPRRGKPRRSRSGRRATTTTRSACD